MIKKNGCTSHYIDASDTSKSNWMRFVNCATVESRQNLIAFQFKGEIYYRTCKPVLASCELLVWYGESYAKELGIDLTEDEIPNHTAGAYVCKRCNSTFASEDFLKAYARNQEDERSALEHKCGFCSYSSSKSTSLERHLLTHTGEKPHKCETCSKQFTQKHHLEDHLVVHSGAHPFASVVCGKGFSQNYHLQRHRRQHVQEKPYKCLSCGVSFSQKTHLQYHTRMHMGQKPYVCDFRCTVCSHLKQHTIAKHTWDFPHECATCNKGFRTPSELQKHL